MYALGIAEIVLVDEADLREALVDALRKDDAGNSAGPSLAACAAQVRATAWAQVKRLATARISDLDAVEHTLDSVARHAQAIVLSLTPQLKVADEAALVPRVTDATLPLSSAVAAIESAARAAGFDLPDDAVRHALREVANLQLWASAGAEAFRTGRRTRERAGRPRVGTEAHGDPVARAIGRAISEAFPTEPRANASTNNMPSTHVHAGRELGLVVIDVYRLLTGRPVSISRKPHTKTSTGGSVSGPLARFVLTVFARMRFHMAREPSLARFAAASAFNPTGETVANWTRVYKRNPRPQNFAATEWHGT